MITGLDKATGCTVEEILQFAEVNNLVITTNINFIQTCIVIFVIGAVVGVVVWELFKYMRTYGKQRATNKP